MLDEATADSTHRPRRVLDLRAPWPRAMPILMSPYHLRRKRSPAGRLRGRQPHRVYGPQGCICDEAGVAHCRAADVISSWMRPSPRRNRILRHDYGCDVLTPDRFASPASPRYPRGPGRHED
ncbi:MAG: hypothetical protein ACLUW6_07540 [Coriobacteriaceae bacterium]